jgi:Lar family restriction alleviation protein
MNKLKPCPFCGAEATFFGERERETEKKGKFRKEAALMCLGCRARGPIVATRDEALAAWNTRQEGRQ